MKITKSQLKQIIKEELQNVLNESADKEQKWNEFAEKYGGVWVRGGKDGMKAIWIAGHDGAPRINPGVINNVGLETTSVTMQEGDVTIVTDIPVSGGSSLDADGDGDLDGPFDPEAVRKALRTDLSRLKAAARTKWTVERTMAVFGDAPPMADEEDFETALWAALKRKNPRSEQEAKDIFEEVYKNLEQRSEHY